MAAERTAGAVAAPAAGLARDGTGWADGAAVSRGVLDDGGCGRGARGQRADGRIDVPDALKPFVGKDVIGPG